MKNAILLLISILTAIVQSLAQQVPILQYAVDINNRVQLTVASTADHYYVLHLRHQSTGSYEQAASITTGKNGAIVLTEPLAAYPLDHYMVTEHLKSAPADTDKDGLNDMEEFADLGEKSPLNAAKSIDFIHGTVAIPDRATFKKLAFQDTTGGEVIEFVKFFIHNRDLAQPELYFINSNTYTLHTPFANAIGYTNDGTLMTGTIAFHPNLVAANGVLGTYRFFFQPNNAFSFAYVQKAMELLAANMPFLKNNLCYYPLEAVGLPLYFQEEATYNASRVCALFEDDLGAEIDYLVLNVAEGYGLLRVMGANEMPSSRDIVLYETLPNELPRVGGIITTVMQTPLSHINLRAIQDKVPNAFIRHALQEPGIDSLIGKYVYFRADPINFTLREASLAEVDAFYNGIRPAKGQTPLRDLSQTHIKPLDSISFAESASFGVKCANVATMRGFGFPDGTIPNGYGIPFYFYDAFMQYNGFYDQVQAMLDDAAFKSDFNVQIQRLAALRKAIKAAPMPSWMIDELSAMQLSFPPGTSIRCRSSTNNEDLPGFSGAGLYDSKTQHPDEGHISKSVKQVYASTWNFRAFEEREFYRIDHLTTAMGVLIHPNHENEKANGVGVSTDPLYQTNGTYYLNTQVGDDLVTNPNALSVPEEILLDAIPGANGDYVVINPSNQVPSGTLVMPEAYLDQMRGFLGTIHEQFQLLYNAVGKEGFAMEIEYKINAEDILVVKQARPWASFWANQDPGIDTTKIQSGIKIFPNPVTDMLHLQCACQSEITFEIYTLLGQKVASERVDFRKSYRQIPVAQLEKGIYFVLGIDHLGKRVFSERVVKI